MGSTSKVDDALTRS